MIQHWFCDVCGAKGHVRLQTHVGVWEGAEAVRGAHRQQSPDCRADPRVIAPAPPEGSQP